MNLKGKQLKRVRRYWSADPLQRSVARLRHSFKRMRGTPVLNGYVSYIEAGPFTLEQWGKLKTKVKKGMTVSYSLSKQMTQPLPQTVDIEAWSREFDAMALCGIFGDETYKSSQVND